jgi:hypothetical protein
VARAADQSETDPETEPSELTHRGSLS